jgi:hypothetical protein
VGVDGATEKDLSAFRLKRRPVFLYALQPVGKVEVHWRLHLRMDNLHFHVAYKVAMLMQMRVWQNRQPVTDMHQVATHRIVFFTLRSPNGGPL